MAKSKKRKTQTQNSNSTYNPTSHRNREGRTGLDPIDSYREIGYAQGLFLRGLFTGRLRTRNPMLLLGLALLGLLTLAPLLAAWNEWTTQHTVNPGLYCFIPLGVIGVMCLVNVALSIPLFFQESE